MKIKDILKEKKPTISFEVFPPKNTGKYEEIEKSIKEIADLAPDFMSVTYGASGSSNNNYTVKIASEINNIYGVTALAHLTCVNTTKTQIDELLNKLKENNVENILALRGDITQDSTFPSAEHYSHACHLINEIKSKGEFCIGGACYPECHIESQNKDNDIKYLKEKVDAGCDFLTTQMFFDNNILYNFLYRIREIGISVPVIAGIMPVSNSSQIKRICELSGTKLPPRFVSIIDKFGDNPKAMAQAGIAYATEQVIDLIANGVNAVHIYTMNKPEIARRIKENLSEIL